MFPSLSNNCYLDWITEWPNEALLGVSHLLLKDDIDELEIKENFDNICEIFRFMHKSVE